MARQNKIARNYMDIVPKHSPNRPWRVREDGMVEIDMENKGFYHSIAQKFFKKPRISHIALDKYGSVVWQNIDGKHTIYEIAQIMEQEFPEEKERMLDRVVTYFATLQRSKFIVTE
ncbi:MAG: PqqD family protein [Agathobacter sp.]|nr:PqqD family protein [Agathobacter sp.]